MYLVELRPGKEELYRTGDDLAAAIRRGDVDVHSRIYHRATSKWISITLHPQYKAIVAQKAAEPLPPLQRSTWTYLTAQSETLAGAEPDGHGTTPGTTPVSERATPPWRRLFALSVAGLALLFGVQLAFSGPRPPWSDAGQSGAPVIPASVREEQPRRDEQVISLASTSTAWDQPAAAEAVPAAAAPAPVALPRAPKLRLKTLGDVLPGAGNKANVAAGRTVEGLLLRYAAAYDSVRARLGSGVRVARLNQLLAPSRLTADGGVTDTRLGLAGVANFIRVYRQQESTIEREFQDSFTVMSKTNGWTNRSVRQWYSRTALKEPPAHVTLSSHLMAGIDSVLGVLGEQAGAYKLGEGTILFEDAAASRRYGQLRRQVVSLIDSAKAAGGDESEGPLGYLLQAIGTSRLPREI
jgi:hypothetical protein